VFHLLGGHKRGEEGIISDLRREKERPGKLRKIIKGKKEGKKRIVIGGGVLGKNKPQGETNENHSIRTTHAPGPLHFHTAL